jgi:RHS repeat-associated protein
MQASSLHDYSNQSFPVQSRPSLADIHTVTWYDNYGFKQLSMIGSNYNFPPIPPGGNTSNSFVSNVKGMITGSLDRVDGMPGLDLVTANYYDNRLRLICSVSDNHLGGRNNGFFGYNFSNEITESITSHYVDGQASEQIVLITKYSYDHQGRLLEEKQKLNGNDFITLKSLQYNEIGDVINTYLHSSADGQNFNQKIENTYNIRGWLRKMNDPYNIGHNLFALDLRYQNPDGPAAIQADPRYNGNITQMRWNSKYDLPRAYGFSYDPLNRLTAARYGQGNAYSNNAGHFNTTYAYDANGNIGNLSRKQNNTLIDILTYTYDGNRLHHVSDFGTTEGYVPYTTGNYQYYPNGNLRDDPSKKIEVSYNYLNLPNKIEFDNNDYITYAYSASGAKLRKTVTTAKTATGGITDYSGPFLYRDNQLSCIFAPAGRIVLISINGNVLWKYEYNLTDHLGNVRVVFAAHSHGQPEVMQQTSYYPFGMTLQQQNFGGLLSQPNKLLYNSKELQDDELAGSRLDWYDYGARFYDAQLGRWHVVDPLAEKYYPISPYAYVANNPMIFIDPDGMSFDWVHDKENNDYVWMDNVTSPENTPEGFRYVGDNDNDILTDLNIPHDLVSQETTKIGFGLDGESGKGGAPIGTQANASGNIAISPIVSLDSKNADRKQSIREKI